MPTNVPVFPVPESSTCPSLLPYVSLLVAHACEHVPAFPVPVSSTCPSLLSYISLLVAHSCPSFSRSRLHISSFCFLLSRHLFVPFLIFLNYFLESRCVLYAQATTLGSNEVVRRFNRIYLPFSGPIGPVSMLSNSCPKLCFYLGRTPKSLV